MISQLDLGKECIRVHKIETTLFMFEKKTSKEKTKLLEKLNLQLYHPSEENFVKFL